MVFRTKPFAVALAITSLGFSSNAEIREDSLVVPRPTVLNGTTIVFETDAFIELRYSENPIAVAEIVFRNRRVNGPRDNGIYHLKLGDVEVDVSFTWDPEGIDDDRIEVTTGPRYWVQEPLQDVMEGSEAIILIYQAMS